MHNLQDRLLFLSPLIKICGHANVAIEDEVQRVK